MNRVQLFATATTAVIVVGIGLVPALAAERGITLFLAGPSYPQSFLRVEEPLADLVVDLDRGRDPAPGLTLLPGGDPVREAADELHQDFGFDVSGHDLTGPARARLWIGAPEAGEATVVAHLLDCDRYGVECVDLGGDSVTVAITEADRFVDAVLTIDVDDRTFGSERTLELSVTNAGNGPLWLGYDARTVPSRIHLHLAAPTPATATTHPTIINHPPAPASAPPPPTSPPPTVAPRVTTTVPAGASSTMAPDDAVPDPTSSEGAGDEELAALVFDYSVAAAGAVPADGTSDGDLVVRLAAGWPPFRAAVGAAFPWLVDLAMFGLGLSYVMTKKREVTDER